VANERVSEKPAPNKGGWFSRRRLIIIGDIALVLIVVIGAISYFLTKSTTCDFPLTMQGQPPLNEIVESPTIRHAAPPWPAEPAGLEQRMAAANTPAAPTGQPAKSFTFQLKVYYKGQPVTVPAGIGRGNGVTAAINTTDTSGTIHVDLPRNAPSIDMSDVFAVWGVRMTANSLGDACNQGNSVFRLFLGSTPIGGDVGVEPLDQGAQGQTYTYTMGTDQELPRELYQHLAPEQRMPPVHPSAKASPGG
jgi:hypothetical protein